LSLVIGRSLRIVALGVVCGIVLATTTGKLIASLLYGVTPYDPVAMGLVATLLLAIGAVAALVPAWRAATTDPATALRAD
jgi:ABC-type antimicrobial peptide transport system permease subunit